jgi:polyphenol oxidase
MTLKEKMVIKPKIFEQFPNLIAAQSTRVGGVSPLPYGLNLSSHVGDEKPNVEENRRRFFEAAGIHPAHRIVYQNQVHSSNINFVEGEEHIVPESDALVTKNPNVVVAVSIADCTPVLIYDPKTHLTAAVHAGWRGTEQMITLNAVRRLMENGANPLDLHCFVGASASKEKYEVGFDVATLFEKKYLTELGSGKFLLDVKQANVDQLLYAGVPLEQIEVCSRCTIADEDLHSYRRDGKKSGRMLAVIGRVA